MYRTSAPWLIYAIGGGFGHLTRACALARAARATATPRILTNSAYTPIVRKAMPDVNIVAVDPAQTLTESCRDIVRHIQSMRFDCLIVDTFPRGLGGELVGLLESLPGFKVFVQRDLNPRYVAAFNLTPFVRHSYDLVLAPGDVCEAWEPFSQSAVTPPWLIRSSDEILDRHTARKILGIQDDKPCVIVCASGTADEFGWYGASTRLLARAAKCHVRCIAPACPDGCPPEHWLPYWPAMDLYAGAAVVIGGAGYNTVHECLACGIPLLARPWPRKYDRQQLRAERAATAGCIGIVYEPEQAAAAALKLLASAYEAGCQRRFYNGATEAVAAINHLLMHPTRFNNISCS